MTRQGKSKEWREHPDITGRPLRARTLRVPTAKPNDPALLPIATASPSSNKETLGRVVLVHGMLAGQRSMEPLAKRLSALGYHVSNWKYPSLGRSMRVHAQRFVEYMQEDSQVADPTCTHFVGHSMGCIILRLALLRWQPSQGCRFVMLAPPNRGSRLTRLPVRPIARWFPHLEELSVEETSLVNQLPDPSGVEVGVIAADKDRVVTLESTHLNNQQDHCVVSTTHQRLPSCEAAIRQIESFLREGRFERDSWKAADSWNRRAA